MPRKTVLQLMHIAFLERVRDGMRVDAPQLNTQGWHAASLTQEEMSGDKLYMKLMPNMHG